MELKATRSNVTGTHGIKVKYFNLQLFICLKWFISKIFAYVTDKDITVFFYTFQKFLNLYSAVFFPPTEYIIQ